MTLASDEIKVLLQELEGRLEDSRVDNFRQRDDHSFFLALRSPARERLFLLLSTRPSVSRFHLVAERPGAVPSPGPFADVVRRYLKGARLTRIRQVSGDRVVEMTFERRRGEKGDSYPDGVSATESVRLILEIRGGRGHLVLVEGRGALITTLHPLRRGSVEVNPGAAYRFPEARAEHGALKGMVENPWRYLQAGEGVGPGEYPFHAALAERYAALESRELLMERREALLASLRRETARRSRAVEKVRGDLAGAGKGEEYRQKGELLKGAFHRLKRGMDSVELEDYFRPGFDKVVVELDPARGPQQNVESYFKRYRKCRRAIPILEERLARLEGELARGRALLDAASTSESLGELEEIARDASGYCRRPRSVKVAVGAAKGRLGPRRFVSGEGFEILVGRNARGNDDLTLRIGHGNDLFLHVAGSPGAHVIVRTPSGKTVPLETLLDAALLAVYYSLPERSRGAAAVGMKAEVDYTPLKYVRKTKGLKPGAVLLSTHKALRVRLEIERLDRLRQSTGEA